LDASGDHRVGTRAGATLMRAWLQIQVEGCAARPIAGLLQRENFGVLHAVIGMGTRANFAAGSVYDYRAHCWVR
jgi:hypothetical protein